MKEEGHKLDAVESKLYSRTLGKDMQYKKHELEARTWETPKKWEGNEGEDVENNSINMRKQKNPFYKLLIGSFIFFGVSLLIAFYFISQGGNTVSPDKINITIGGPIQIGGGQELALDIGVENKNSVPLELIDLVVDYPSGTKSAEDTRADLKRERINLGDIKAGGFAHKIFKSVLFGEEGSSEDIKATIEYRVPGSNAIFTKDKTFSLTLNSSPVAIITKGVNEITSGQLAQFEITVTSNSEKELKNIVLKADYPFGYSFKDSDPKPTNGSNTWNIGILSPKESKTIKVSGIIQGQNNEERYFKFTVGNANATDSSEIGTILALSSQLISIKKPFIGVNLSFDQDNSNAYAVKDGQVVHAMLDWVNNTASVVSNAEIEAVFYGNIFDKTSINVSDGGFYDSSKNTITWNKKTNEVLGDLKPGDTGRFGFSFTVNSSNVKDKQQMNVDINARGQRASESNVEESIQSTVSKKINLTTDLGLASQAFYFTGPFENSGPMPPKAENNTTYTVTWVVTNTNNGISNAKVTTTLPSYVSWNNVVSPSSENISFDSVTGNLVWNIGNVTAQTGLSNPKKQVSFQIAVKPSVSQVGTSPVIVGTQTLTGYDNFANAEVKDVRSALTTRLTEDGQYTSNDDEVQP